MQRSPAVTAMPTTLRYRGFVRAYGSAVAGIAAVTLFRLPLEPLLRGSAPYALYYLPILWTAWYAGIGPTTLAIALSLASAWVFVVPRLEPGDFATVGIF